MRVYTTEKWTLFYYVEKIVFRLLGNSLTTYFYVDNCCGHTKIWNNILLVLLTRTIFDKKNEYCIFNVKTWGKVERIYEDLTIHSNVYK